MRRLCWKEFYERRVWIAVSIAAVIITTAFGNGLPCYSPMSSISSWVFLPAMLITITGLIGYGSELTGNRAAFLYSRAVSWKQIWWAKVLVGLGAVGAASLLGMLTCVLTAPGAYRQFLTPANLVIGTGEFAGILLLAYLTGLGCSIVLPGLAGGILVMLPWYGLFPVMGMLTERVLPNAKLFFAQLGCLLSPLIAAVVIARFGITLSLGTRAVRYFLVMFITLGAGICLDILLPTQRLYATMDRLFTGGRQYYQVCVSPSGQDVYTEAWVNTGRTIQQYLWFHPATGERQPFPEEIRKHWISIYGWTDADQLLTTASGEEGKSVKISWWEQGHIRTQAIPAVQIDNTNEFHISPSPKKDRLLISTADKMVVYSPRTNRIQILIAWDEQQRLRYSEQNPIGFFKPPRRCWWQTEDVVGYIDPFNGKRVLVTVAE